MFNTNTGTKQMTDLTALETEVTILALSNHRTAILREANESWDGGDKGRSAELMRDADECSTIATVLRRCRSPQ